MSSYEFMDQIKKWAKNSENIARQKAMLKCKTSSGYKY